MICDRATPIIRSVRARCPSPAPNSSTRRGGRPPRWIRPRTVRESTRPIFVVRGLIQRPKTVVLVSRPRGDGCAPLPLPPLIITISVVRSPFAWYILELAEQERDRKAERFQKKAIDAVSEALKKLQNADQDCQNVFAALAPIGGEGLLGKVTDILSGIPLTFLDGTTATQTVGQLFGNGLSDVDPNTTIANLFKNGLPDGTKIEGLSAPGGMIFFRERAINWQNMVHEVLHQVDFSFLTDRNMLLFLNAKYPDIKVNNDTSQISDLIKDKCK